MSAQAASGPGHGGMHRCHPVEDGPGQFSLQRKIPVGPLWWGWGGAVRSGCAGYWFQLPESLV